jgi:peptidoglycan/LPS O-acetylase OafA/YrhL
VRATGRVAYVDGLRGLAALAVLIYHATLWLQLALGDANPLGFALRLGAYGVELFFVLSGFCLAYPFLQRREGLDLVRFATRRIVRIVPPYWAAIALLAVALAFGKTSFILGTPVPGGWDVLRQALFLDRNTQFLSGTFWTLALELRWYLLFPFALWLWTVSPRAFAVAGLSAVVAFRLTTAGAADLYALPAFMLGIVAADVALHRRVRAPQAARWFVLLLLPALAVDWIAGPQQHLLPIGTLDVRDYLPPQRTLWQFASFALVVLAAAAPFVQRILAWRPLVLCGEASYSIYLIHAPVMFALHRALGTVAHRDSVLNAALAAGASLAAGFVFWRIVEYPITETPLKDVCIARLRPHVLRAFAWLRVPTLVPLFAAGSAHEAQRVGPQELPIARV